MNKVKIGVVDTTFSRVDMYSAVAEALNELPVELVRKTVPGMKDTPVACKILLEKEGCNIAIALCHVGKEKIDEQCAHEANIGIQFAQLLSNKHILGVFVHETEALIEGKLNENEFKEIALNRARKHALNAYWLIAEPNALKAGSGKRQGKQDVGEIK
ncbi:riboflavin synthase [Candidatus Micrarchaeota archaeon]|nr:riboflavin synthase [Candidatus Micrarchaeota archaeon]